VLQPAQKGGCPNFLLIFCDFLPVSILVVDGVGTGAWQKFDQSAYIVDPLCKKA
jgi:hypothetical protein